MKLKNPFHHEPVDPSKPHHFVATIDEGMSQAASGSGGRQGAVARELGVMTRSVPSDRCLLAGCGKDREAAIHWTVPD